MTYTVKPGDTLYSIAQRYNTTVDAIVAANPQITDPNVLSVGQVIVIPVEIPRPPVDICPTLRIGSRGPAVIKLQKMLMAASFDPGTIDGIFGANTQSAVILFQTSKALAPDGIVGPLTWAALGVKCT